MIPSMFPTQFIAASSFEAIIRRDEEDQVLLIEMRKHRDGKWTVFAIIDGQEIRVASLQELVLMRKCWGDLIIPHNVSVMWNDRRKQARFEEIYSNSG